MTLSAGNSVRDLERRLSTRVHTRTSVLGRRSSTPYSLHNETRKKKSTTMQHHITERLRRIVVCLSLKPVAAAWRQN